MTSTKPLAHHPDCLEKTLAKGPKYPLSNIYHEMSDGTPRQACRIIESHIFRDEDMDSKILDYYHRCCCYHF